MNIAVLGIRGLPANYSGFETCADHTTKFWSEKGDNVLVYCRKNRYKERANHYGKVRLKYVGQIESKSFETLSHTFLCILDLLLNERKFKVIHLYNTGNALFLPILKLFGKKVIISVDGIEWKRDKWGFLAKQMYKLGERIAVRLADEIISDNQEVESYFQTKFSKNTRIIAYGAKMIAAEGNDEEFLKAYELIKNQYFLFVGRLVPEKGVHHLIRAYNNLHTDFPLAIIGDDHVQSKYKADLYDMATPKVRFLGFKFGDEYETILKNAQMYVSASSLEGTSPSLLAAMGAGVCALVNGIPENRHTAGDAAYYFEENRFDNLETTWQELAESPRKVAQMASKGKNHVAKNYSWEKIADDYIDTFNTVSSRQRG